MKKSLFLMFFPIILSFTFATSNVVQRGNLCIDLDNGKIVNGEECGISTISNNQTNSGININSGTNNEITNNSGYNIGNNTNTEKTGNINIETGSKTIQTTNNIISETNNKNNSGTTIESTTKIAKPTIKSDTIFSGQDELSNAILRMYANGLTKFQTKEKYMINSPLTREQMAKMISQVYIVLGYPEKEENNNCNFNDIDNADPTLKSFIIKSCKLGLLNGRDGNFHPQQTLTKAQALTIMIRLFEGKKSDENVNPWWKNYITKAQSIGLTKETNPDKFESQIPRGDVALLFYRFKSLVENNFIQKNAIKEMQDSVIGDSSTNKKMNSKTLDDALSLLTQGISAGDDPELREAVFRMYQQKMTEYDSAEKFRAFDQIERQEAAKFLGAFHQHFIKTGNIEGEIPTKCYFKDLKDAKDELKPYILYDCTEGIFDGINGWFHPTHSLTKAEFVASLIRMLGKTYKTTGNTIRWKPYFDQGLKLGLVSYIDRITFNKPITRYEVALLLYRFRIKYQLLENLNNDNIENMVISMIENSEKEINGQKQGKVYITVTKLNDQNFSIGYIDLFRKKYKIVKKNIEKYFTNNYVWYGEVYDMITDKPTGTLSLIVGNNTVLEGNIRPSLGNNTYYKISKPKETNAYYIITEKTEKKTN